MVAVGVLVAARRRCCRGCCAARSPRAGTTRRETQPLVNVAASLLAAAGLTLLAYAVSQPLVALDPSPAAHADPGRRWRWC